MIVSPGRRLIFVHIPKTGGTAMALALEARAMKDDILIGDTPKAKRRRRRLKGIESAGRLWKHSTLADIEGLVPRNELERYMVFTMVRNPWDRMVSYYHWLRAQDFQHPAVDLARRLTFHDFVTHETIRASVAASPYGHYVSDGAGRERCDAFVRLERLEEDVGPVEAHLGFALLPLDRVNRSTRQRDYRGYYTDATAAVVAETCARDVERFGYTF